MKCFDYIVNSIDLTAQGELEEAQRKFPSNRKKHFTHTYLREFSRAAHFATIFGSNLPA